MVSRARGSDRRAEEQEVVHDTESSMTSFRLPLALEKWSKFLDKTKTESNEGMKELCVQTTATQKAAICEINREGVGEATVLWAAIANHQRLHMCDLSQPLRWYSFANDTTGMMIPLVTKKDVITSTHTARHQRDHHLVEQQKESDTGIDDMDSSSAAAAACTCLSEDDATEQQRKPYSDCSSRHRSRQRKKVACMHACLLPCCSNTSLFLFALLLALCFFWV